MLSFIGAFAAQMMLQFYVDHDRVKNETGESGWKIFGSILAPMEFYKVEAGMLWHLRDKGLKIFFIAVGIAAVLAVAAAVLDVSLK